MPTRRRHAGGSYPEMYGAVLNLDADGNVQSVIDDAGSLEVYYALCEAQSIPRPNVLVD